MTPSLQSSTESVHYARRIPRFSSAFEVVVFASHNRSENDSGVWTAPRLWLVLFAALAVWGCSRQGAVPGKQGDEKAGSVPTRKEKIVIRVGHFPNVTHAQGLIGHHFSREAKAGKRPKGWFEERLGENVEILWFVYNAGPSAMEALFAGSLDMTYVGPSPALNAFVRSGGAEIRIVSGAARGGSALVVKKGSSIQGPQDFRGLRVGTPQLGNTQDVACRDWLQKGGLRVTLTGGDVHVIPTANPDQKSLFERGDLDAVWTVEPWVSRLELESEGKVLVDDRESVTTILVSSAKFLRERRDLAGKFVKAHEELTRWIQENPEEARKTVIEALSADTRTAVSPAIVERAWTRLRFAVEVDRDSIAAYLKAAENIGFLQEVPPLSTLFEVVQ